MVQQAEMKRGPWTEQEDFKLVSFVGLFGDRRWDFIAKVSGLKVAGDKYIGLTRTGKSCRLRWVNYLHPGLKRGKLTPKEERLVMELHSKWGNRWSRIARKLPGRTDNEIKNYWRTHMRKKAQEEKRAAAAGAISSPTTTSSCQSSSLSTISNNNNNNHTVNSVHVSKKVGEEESFYDTGGPINMTVSNGNVNNVGANHHNNQDGDDEQGYYYSMDDIWKDIGMLEEENDNTLQQQPVVVYDEHSSEECCNFSCPPILSPSWEYSSSEPLWVMDNEEESKMLFPSSSDQYFFCYEQGSSAFLTG